MTKVSLSKFLSKVEEIYQEKPAYATGGDGSNGKCDCIGLPRGALERAGATGVHNFRGTNNAARHGALENLRKISSIGDLRIGDVVLKTRDKDYASMPLPDQYRRGGSDYSEKYGETNFTHIGVVTGLGPVEITHMTSPTAKKDVGNNLGRWEWVASLPWVDYSGQGSEDPDDQQTDDGQLPAGEIATVWAESGGTVFMRQDWREGSAGYKIWDRVPVGTQVKVLEIGKTWSRISAIGRTGWMMTKFLTFGDDPPSADPEPVAPDPPAEPAGAPTIRKGDKGEWVTKAQSMLINRGYDLGSYGVDGDFGSATEKAIKQFQQDWGLPVDGIVGSTTWKMLECTPVISHRDPTWRVIIHGLDKTQARAIVNNYPGSVMQEE